MLPAMTQIAQAASYTLAPGATGSRVSVVETGLKSLGYYQGSINGMYGPELALAVRIFQDQHHLKATGIAGATTLAALHKATTPIATSSPSLVSQPAVLRLGDAGPMVVQLQTLLVHQRYHVAVDGKFGPATASAVVSFQRAHGFKADGIVGPNTLHALKVDPPPAPKPAPKSAPKSAPKPAPKAAPARTASGVMELGVSGSDVAVLQRELTSLGFNTYGTDGVFGPNTQRAVEAFERSHGLTVDGIAGPGVLSAVRQALSTDRGTSAVTTTSNSTVASSKGLAISGYARVFVGYRYVFGGASPATGFDCSGLVQWVYAHFGINLPRTSYAQYDVGTRVGAGQLQPGDLVFFTTDAPGASHVGIYIGGGQFVAADTPSSGVQIDSMSNPYWSSHFIGGTIPPGV